MTGWQLTENEVRSIIVEAEERGISEGGIPESPEVSSEKSNEIVKLALDAKLNNNVNSEDVNVILGIARIEIEGDIWWQEEEVRQSHSVTNALAQDEEEEQDHFRSLGLPLPERLDTKSPSITEDLTELSNEQLMDRHSKFSACYSVASAEASEFTSQAQELRDLTNHKAAELRRAVETRDEEGKKKSAAEIDREQKDAENEDSVWELRKKYREAESIANKGQALAKIYEKRVDVISRQWAYRQAIYHNSGGLYQDNQ